MLHLPVEGAMTATRPTHPSFTADALDRFAKFYTRGHVLGETLRTELIAPVPESHRRAAENLALVGFAQALTGSSTLEPLQNRLVQLRSLAGGSSVDANTLSAATVQHLIQTSERKLRDHCYSGQHEAVRTSLEKEPNLLVSLRFLPFLDATYPAVSHSFEYYSGTRTRTTQNKAKDPEGLTFMVLLDAVEKGAMDMVLGEAAKTNEYSVLRQEFIEKNLIRIIKAAVLIDNPKVLLRTMQVFQPYLAELPEEALGKLKEMLCYPYREANKFFNREIGDRISSMGRAEFGISHKIVKERILESAPDNINLDHLLLTETLTNLISDALYDHNTASSAEAIIGLIRERYGGEASVRTFMSRSLYLASEARHPGIEALATEMLKKGVSIKDLNDISRYLSAK